MKEVTKDEFLDKIGNMDVIVSIQPGVYPYTVNYLLKNGELKGSMVNSYTDGIEGRHPIVAKYFINK